jgi:beta-glucosidase
MQTTGPGERMDVEGMRGTDAKASTQRRFRAAGGSLIPTADGRTNDTYTVELVAGQRLTLTLSCDSPAAGPVAPCQPTPEQPLQLRLAWTPELGCSAGRRGRAAGRRRRGRGRLRLHEGTEGEARPSLALPGFQDELIAAVADAPRTLSWC